ncbi:arf-GAP domain and FG repeat-containing protein 1a isoform X4 [Polypterus senegalus]|uniref:arf-GAP domain and FG repeat-containing protein 1a isoform X4 n=1 Tax=Polypterus senegalus TaxID=55291 RepID=UPI00196524F7|nr:arf-GAP domain and FG repeat-containing protein 1a isoform X4 [Polypterus senegalus]
MAASAKRKQEEKHLKMLREMTSLLPNRKCFDCDQRGPTYANMTVGSFVCTSCSGILRGLNPPHRVKSISMTTFTQQEIELLQKHGNEVCKQIWLGLYDDRSSAIPDFREPQKVKEFLQEKYEKKRWYVPPEQAKVVASVHASISGSSASSTSSTPEVRPLKSLLGDSAPALHLNKSTPSQSPVVSRVQVQHQQQMAQQFQQEKKQFDLLSDLGGDIFAAPAPQPATSANFANFAHFNSHTAQSNANADFANFDAFGNSSASSSFGGFPTASQPSFQPPITAFRTLSSSCSFGEFTSAFPLPAVHRAGGQASNVNSAPALAPPSHPASIGGDRYAALAELDSVFSSTAPTSNVYSTTSSVSSSVFGTGATQAQSQQAIPSIPAGFGATTSTNPFMAPTVAPASAPTNPFQTNGRMPPTAAAAATTATFGTGSLSMPAGFGATATYNLPTSFSGTFQPPPFPGQAAFTQPATYSQQPNGAGFAAFGQSKPVVTPFGQAMANPGVSSNPFMVQNAKKNEKGMKQKFEQPTWSVLSNTPFGRSSNRTVPSW